MRTILLFLLLLLALPAAARPLEYHGRLLSISFPSGWYVAEDKADSVSFMCDQPKGLITFSAMSARSDPKDPHLLETLRKNANSDGWKMTGEGVVKLAGQPVTCVNFDENGDPGATFYLHSQSHSFLVVIQGQGSHFDAIRATVWKALNDSLHLK